MSALTAAELTAIGEFLRANGTPVDGPLQQSTIAGGRSNITVRLSDGVGRWVLRMPPRAGRTPSAHDVGREYRVIRALASTKVPVPDAVALCADETVIGSPFAIAGFVEGRAIRTRAELDELDDTALDGAVRSLVEVLAALHDVDPDAVGLAGFGRPNGYAARQLRRWTEQWGIVAGPGSPEHALAVDVASRLAEAVPEQDATCIVHGDYRIDNTLLGVSAAPVVTAVVDWELSTLGDPVADVAMMCAYRDPAFDFIIGEVTAWTSPRLPGVDELAAAYQAAGGRRLAHWRFHLALAYFKIAVIAAGIAHRARLTEPDRSEPHTARAAVLPYLEGAQAILRDGE